MAMSDETPTIGATRYTLEDLSDYADRGRRPRVAEIEEDAECRAVLDNIERLGVLSREMLERDVASAPPVDEGWLDRVLASIGRELRAGRDIPLESPDASTRLAITEGAVRELIRAAGDAVEGVLVGSSSITGALDDPDVGIRVHLTVSVGAGLPIPERAEAVRRAVHSELQRHTTLLVEAVDVTVADIHERLTRTDEQ
jgi:hypothetical protein